MSSLNNVKLVCASGMAERAIQAKVLTKKEHFSNFGDLAVSTSAPRNKTDDYWAFLEAESIRIITVDFSDNNGLVKAFTSR
jgi:hypothetical protein